MYHGREIPLAGEGGEGDRDVLIKVIKSVRFGIERSEELVRLIDQLVLLVNWCIQKCLENEVTSRAALHKGTHK